MTITYVDTSAAMKAVFREAESPALIAFLSGTEDRTLVASWLLHTELHCASGRRGGAGADKLATVLGVIDLVDVERADLVSAGTHTPLRAQDAICLAVAIRVGAEELITYDRELAGAATRAGLRVLAPGA